ncbi:MAG: helix-turn-helix domain-containing protein [Actinomycetospora chiangmaiensis]|nr:helix-turn-helix domain-containing protein [Actinomycetospora chiangmaiensis]
MPCAGSDVLVRPADPTGFPEVVTLAEAAALLGWSRQATIEAARAGELPAATFGSPRPSQWRFLRDRVCAARSG